MQRRQLITAIPGLFGAALSLSFPLAARAAETEGTSFAVTDLLGREVRFEKAPERIVVANYILNFLMTGGAASLSKVVALPQDGWEATRTGEYKLLTEAFPSILKLSSIGGYHDNVLNTERILSLKPDVILVNIAQYRDNAQRLAVLERAGVKTVVLDYHAMKPENHAASTRILGKLLGREEAAEAQCRRYEEALKDLQTRIAVLPDEKKHRRVYVELGNEGVARLGNSYNRTVLWGAILEELSAAMTVRGVRFSGETVSYRPIRFCWKDAAFLALLLAVFCIVLILERGGVL